MKWRAAQPVEEREREVCALETIKKRERREETGVAETSSRIGRGGGRALLGVEQREAGQSKGERINATINTSRDGN